MQENVPEKLPWLDGSMVYPWPSDCYRLHLSCLSRYSIGCFDAAKPRANLRDVRIDFLCLQTPVKSIESLVPIGIQTTNSGSRILTRRQKVLALDLFRRLARADFTVRSASDLRI